MEQDESNSLKRKEISRLGEFLFEKRVDLETNELLGKDGMGKKEIRSLLLLLPAS